MKTFWHLLICLLTLFSIPACGNDSPIDTKTPITPIPPVANETDELDFRVLVYIDEASVLGHLGGSERTVKSRLNNLFMKASEYWNSCSHDQLKYKYTYSVANVIIYKEPSNGESEAAKILRKKVYDDPIDFSKYDVTVFFDCLQDNGETGNGGAACGGGKDHRSVITVIAKPEEPKKIFEDNTFRTLVHELGHYRGITDLYQYLIEAKDNPVNGQAYMGPIDCVMNSASAGKWSDYAVKCLNRSAGSKQIGKDFKDFFGDLYPKKLEISVSVSGEPKAGVSVKFYGSRAGGATHNRDIWPGAFISTQTNSNGKFVLENLRQYFIPDRNKFTNLPSDLPYGRWFGFLIEVSHNTTKKYFWLPEYESQMPFFKDEDTYKVNFSL